MLALLGVYHRMLFRMGPDAELSSQVTIAVKTFERPKAVARFVRCARRVFAGRIIVADDSRVTWSSKDPLVKVLPLPFNSGVSVGRNVALDAVTTPYVLITDDDIVFTHASRWEGALDYLEHNPDVDGVAALLIELPRWYSSVHGNQALFSGHEQPLRAPGEIIDGMPVRLKVPQVYLARTESIRKIRWNEELRMLDHSDFFSRAAGKLVFVQAMGLPALHARTPWNRVYTKYRDDTAQDQITLGRLWRRSQGTA
ncbi:MAG: glycosyltransferase [Propionibacteriaceae bacterium]|nr:glycosyltransferase [Propionibacteriaceae bacterium]